jgi:hypothetical protein
VGLSSGSWIGRLFTTTTTTVPEVQTEESAALPVAESEASTTTEVAQEQAKPVSRWSWWSQPEPVLDEEDFFMVHISG